VDFQNPFNSCFFPVHPGLASSALVGSSCGIWKCICLGWSATETHQNRSAGA